MIFVDVDKSLPEEIQRELLEISDLVVVNITQNQKGVQGFLEEDMINTLDIIIKILLENLNKREMYVQ